MNTTELQDLFRAQLDAGQNTVFYMTQQSGSEVHQITASVLKHDTTAGTWDDLLVSLAGYTYHETLGEGKWPKFTKDTV